jgi:hypothetical protein
MEIMSKKVIALVLAVLFISLCLGPAVMAENGENSGSGSEKTPLLLEQSSPADNDLGVAVDAIITLTFSKNIVNMSVADNNLLQFQLREVGGEVVAIDVFLADDQVDREKRNDASITPIKPFKEDTDYELIVNKELSSKSGVLLADDLVINFSTKQPTKGGSSYLIGVVILVGIGLALIMRNRKKA